MAAPFKKQQTADRDLQLVQDNVSNALAPLQSMPMVGGNVLTGVALGTSQTSVPHGLGRTPQYFTLLDLNANAAVYRSAPSDDNFIYLKAGASCTVSLWVN